MQRKQSPLPTGGRGLEKKKLFGKHLFYFVSVLTFLFKKDYFVYDTQYKEYTIFLR